MAESDVVIGVDAGGTSSRGLLATSDGRRLATATGRGVNQRSSRDSPAEVLTGLLAQLASAAPGAAMLAVLGVIGVAGAGTAGLAAARTAAERAWRTAGLPGDPSVVPDIAVAHAAGSPSAHGTVLVAGTGAVAAAIRDGEVVRRADGHGWLLGDTGSAVWLGVQAARATLAALDGREETTQLAGDVLHELSALDNESQPPAGHAARASAAQRVIGVVDGMRPAELGRLAPLVSRAAEAGDPVAHRLVTAAVDGLMCTLATVHDGIGAGHNTEDEPAVVLAGSVLLRPGPVRSGVRLAVAERWGVDALDAGDGAGGAAVLALRRAGHLVTVEVHQRLTAP